ncbi:RecX family transcriptional regulator [candidate division KSB1 bacterium]|nr:RecX family transcriptional regulator [candidate division KSB1 bacterium]
MQDVVVEQASAKITRIEGQKKKKNRFSVYLDDAFAFGLNVATLAEFNLKEGDLLTDDRIADILRSEGKKQIKESAFRYLAGRAHSEKELRTKLRRKQYDETLVDQIIAELKQAKLIDDRGFAFSFARSRMVSKPMGERLLRQELWQKGLAEKLIDDTIKEIYAETSQEDVALQLLEKRRPRYKNLTQKEQKKRLYDFLVRRGFGWDVVNDVLHSE